MEMMRIDNICKSFDGKTLLDDVCISVQNNQITGLFGNDGAGKTVLIDIVTGRCPADGGDVGFFSEKGWIDYNRAAHDIALVREELVTDTYFTIGMYIDIVKKIYSDIDMDLLYDVLYRFNLDVHNRVMFLMNDTQVKLQIAIAVARRPKLMILDEPFTGLFWKTTESVKSILS